MKEPVPPQPLVEARIAVSEVIAKENILSEEAAVRIKLWHGEIKKWQDNDQLDTAFSEGRLTLRTMSNEEKKYDYKKENLTYDTGRFGVLGKVIPGKVGGVKILRTIRMFLCSRIMRDLPSRWKAAPRSTSSPMDWRLL